MLEGRPCIDFVFSVAIDAKASFLPVLVVLCFIGVYTEEPLEAAEILIDYMMNAGSLYLNLIIFFLQSGAVCLHGTDLRSLGET